MDTPNRSFDVIARIASQIIGSLMYLTTTKTNIVYSVSIVSRYMENPIYFYLLIVKRILLIVKRILLYLKGTVEYRLFYKKEKSQI
jgi:uncharacterized protein YybS (DUF2232 family)